MKNIEQLVTQVFTSTDNHDWESLKSCFTNLFVLDYESMSNQPAVQISPEQLADSWSSLLPGFDSTHHQIGNIIVKETDSGYHVSCYGTATHFIENENPQVWTVYGTYDFNIRKSKDAFKIYRMTFNYKFQTGNLGLASIASSRI